MQRLMRLPLLEDLPTIQEFNMSWTFKIENGDIVRAPYNNGYLQLEGSAKLKQDVEMCLTTDIRSSSGIGCGLDEVIGKDVMNPVSSFMQFPAVVEFQSRVTSGMNRLKRILERTLLNYRSQSELIVEVSPVQIWPMDDDPRNYRWRVDILSGSGEDIPISGTTR